jgi:RNA polymerase sigma-70 factor (ECF subfamily)
MTGNGSQQQAHQLLERCKKGDAQAQQQLFDQYFGLLLAIGLRYTHDREEAKDLLQEAFVKIFKGIVNLERVSQLENWMKRIMINTAIDRYRSQVSEPWVQDIDQVDEPSEPEQASQNLTQEELLQLIQSLPAGYRTIFNLAAIEGYNHKEIAERTGISEGTSKSQLARARQMLQEKVREYLANPYNE